MRAGCALEREDERMRYIIDRIEEGKTAVCEKEDGSLEEIGIGRFGFEVNEGDCIVFDEETGYKKDERRKKEIQKEVEELMENLFS